MADTTSTTTVHTAEVVRYDDPVVITERVAVAVFIVGYRDTTADGFTRHNARVRERDGS